MKNFLVLGALLGVLALKLGGIALIILAAYQAYHGHYAPATYNLVLGIWVGGSK